MIRTIASNDQELIFFGDVVLLDVGVGGDNLGLWREVGALLELEVTNGARQGEVAVDTAKVNEAAGSGDSVLLGCAGQSVIGVDIPSWYDILSS